MRSAVVLFFAVVWVSQPCCSRSLVEEESVVSVYTTQSTTAGTAESVDVYHQIANNIAERITSPIYRFLGIGNNSTAEKTTKRPWDKIEILDDPEDVTKPDLKPVDNDISVDKEVEELSVEALRRVDKKPEKLTLYSSYLPARFELNVTSIKNDTSNDIDDDFDTPLEFDDDEEETSRDGPFVYILELLGSFIQLLWGGFLSLFKPSTNSS